MKYKNPYISSNLSGRDVWFDDISISNYRGAVLDEHFYYPFGLTLSSESAEETGQPYKLTTKELEKSFDLNMYDFSAREFDMQLGRWMQIDPLVEHPKQISSPPFSFNANNPVRYIDPSGMIWIDPKDKKKLKKTINRQISSLEKDIVDLQTKIDENKLSRKKLEKTQKKIQSNKDKIDNLNTSLDDVNAIGKSHEKFKLNYSGVNGVQTVFKNNEGVIQIEGDGMSIYLHEIRHIGQALESNRLIFSKEGFMYYPGRTQRQRRQNEVDAYRIQYSYDGSYPGQARSLEEINEKSIMQIRHNGELLYKELTDTEKK